MRNLFFMCLMTLCTSCIPTGTGKFKHHSDQLPALESEYPKTFVQHKGAEFVYKAAFNLPFTYFSGILVFKMMDNLNLRATLITEVGNKIFDFELSDSSREMHYCIGPLRKANGIMKLIEEDFRILFAKGLDARKNKLFSDASTLMLKSTLNHHRIYFFAKAADREVYTIKRAGGLKGKMHMKLSDYTETYPDEIHISHPRIRFSITLTPREKNKA